MQETKNLQYCSHKDLPVLTSHMCPSLPKIQGSTQPEIELAVHRTLATTPQLGDGPKATGTRYLQHSKVSNKALSDQI